MKTLSIRQPWAWAILHAGKDIENRTWVTLHRGPVLIHASQTYDRDGHRYIEDVLGIPVPAKLLRGGIVGIVDITGCTLQSASKWFEGPCGFILANARELPFRPYKGRLGLFEVKTHEAYIREPSDRSEVSEYGPPVLRTLINALRSVVLFEKTNA